LFVFTLLFFGIRIEDVVIKDENDMNKIYRTIEPKIRAGRFNAAARILSIAYGKYASIKKRNSNVQETPYWAYLDNAIRCCGKYDMVHPYSQESCRFRDMVADSIRLAFPGIAQIDSC
jgi:DNA repair photolyase